MRPYLLLQAINAHSSLQRRESQRPDTYMACALQKLTSFSSYTQSIWYLYNESRYTMFCHISKWSHQLSIIRAYALQFTHAAATQAFRSAWEVCTYLKIATNVNRSLLPDNNQQISFTHTFSLSYLQIKCLKCGRPTI